MSRVGETRDAEHRNKSVTSLVPRALASSVGAADSARSCRLRQATYGSARTARDNDRTPFRSEFTARSPSERVTMAALIVGISVATASPLHSQQPSPTSSEPVHDSTVVRGFTGPRPAGSRLILDLPPAPPPPPPPAKPPRFTCNRVFGAATARWSCLPARSASGSMGEWRVEMG